FVAMGNELRELLKRLDLMWIENSGGGRRWRCCRAPHSSKKFLRSRPPARGARPKPRSRAKPGRARGAHRRHKGDLFLVFRLSPRNGRAGLWAASVAVHKVMRSKAWSLSAMVSGSSALHPRQHRPKPAAALRRGALTRLHGGPGQVFA